MILNGQQVKSNRKENNLTNPVPQKSDAVSRIDGCCLFANVSEFDKYIGFADKRKIFKLQRTQKEV